MRTDRLVINTVFAALIGGIASAQSGGNFVIKDATLEGSGHSGSGGNFVSEIRLGQGLAGQSMSGGPFAVGGGIFPAPPTPEKTAPTAPADLSAVAPSTTLVRLSWTDTSTNEEGFRIERCTVKGRRCSGGEVVGIVDPDVATFEDLTVVKNTTYKYQLFAFNTAGDSPASNVVTVKTPKR